MTKKIDVHRTPLTCELFVLNDRDKLRRDELVKDLGSSLREVYDLPNGYGLTFDASTSTLAELVEFIALERLCCPFLHFDLVVPEENNPIKLEMTGREGVKQFLSAELGIQRGGNA